MHLLLWSVGPIQDFIAAARRTLDLWYGSHLLSEVSRAAALSAQAAGSTLLLPSARTVADRAIGIANKVLVEVPGGIDPEAVARGMDQAAVDRLRVDARAVFDGVQTLGRLDRDAACRQIDDLLERQWAVTARTASFQADRRRVEHLLAATKAQRPFEPPSWGSHLPKSSLDGAREEVIDLRKAPSLRRALGVLDQEVLDGVGLLKRGAPRNKVLAPDMPGRIPSVSAAAAMPFLRRAEAQPNAAEAWERYLATVRSLDADIDPNDPVTLPLVGRWPVHLVYASRLHEFWPDEDDRKRAERAVRELLETLGVGAPDPYYALVQADGDRMGRVLDRATTEGALTGVGEALAAFSGAVRGIVKDHDGFTIFAGGDDVLAFVPVGRALAFAAALRSAYDTRVGAVATQLVPDARPTTTLSVGIAIVHHLEPLATARDHAQEAEKAAKAAGRDAWCLRRVARSGDAAQVAAQWKQEGSAPFGLLDVAVGHYQRHGLPRGLPYDLRAAADRLLGTDGDADEGTQELARAVAGAVFAQKNVDATGLLDAVDGITGLRRLADVLILARALTGEVTP
jgi:CRISPR-associated protein Cmr2